MKLFVGLGNPGEKYKNNRHNVGHMVVDAFGEVPPGVVLKKTTVFMNNSGEEVSKLTSFYKVKPADLYVIHDDLDIKLGEYKFQKGKGPKLHNGVESVEQVLGTADFWRVRIGVDDRDPQDRTPGEQYVLQDFTGEERKIVDEVIKDVVAELILRSGAN